MFDGEGHISSFIRIPYSESKQICGLLATTFSESQKTRSSILVPSTPIRPRTFFTEITSIQSALKKNFTSTFPLSMPSSKRFEETQSLKGILRRGFCETFATQGVVFQGFTNSIPITGNCIKKFEETNSVEGNPSTLLKESKSVEGVSYLVFSESLPIKSLLMMPFTQKCLIQGKSFSRKEETIKNIRKTLEKIREIEDI